MLPEGRERKKERDRAKERERGEKKRERIKEGRGVGKGERGGRQGSGRKMYKMSTQKCIPDPVWNLSYYQVPQSSLCVSGGDMRYYQYHRIGVHNPLKG